MHIPPFVVFTVIIKINVVNVVLFVDAENRGPSGTIQGVFPFLFETWTVEHYCILFSTGVQMSRSQKTWYFETLSQ